MGKCLLMFFLYIIITYASPQDTCIIFTEIMFDAPSGNNEFIELYNRSETKSINLFHFKITTFTNQFNLSADCDLQLANDFFKIFICLSI